MSKQLCSWTGDEGRLTDCADYYGARSRCSLLSVFDTVRRSNACVPLRYAIGRAAKFRQPVIHLQGRPLPQVRISLFSAGHSKQASCSSKARQ